MMKPLGSLGPGMMNLAINPATKPMMIVQMIPIFPSSSDASGATIAQDEWRSLVRRVLSFQSIAEEIGRPQGPLQTPALLGGDRMIR
jgi:hypothetical protein